MYLFDFDYNYHIFQHSKLISTENLYCYIKEYNNYTQKQYIIKINQEFNLD